MKTRLTGILFALFLVGTQYDAMAQLTKGTFYIGPSFSMNYSEESFTHPDFGDWKQRMFSKSGQTDLGFAVADNLFLGLELYSEQSLLKTTSDVPDIKSIDLRIGAGPVLGYRIPVARNFYIPIEGSFIIGPSIFRQKDGDEVTNKSTDLFTQVNFRFGVEYLIDGKVGVFVKGGPTLTTDYYEFDTDSDFNISSRFGVNFYLNPEMRKAHKDKMQ